MSPEEWLKSQGGSFTPAVIPVSGQTQAVDEEGNIVEGATVEVGEPISAQSPEEWMAQQETPETTVAGLGGAATRGLALPAAGAVLGAMAGAPFAGVGAIPGAIAGAGAATIAGMVGDPIVGSINSLFGTKYTLPTDALEDLLTRVGVPEARTSAEKIVQTTMAGAGGAGGMVAAGQAMQRAAGSAMPVLRGVGELIATAPAMQVASGATAGAAGQIAKESGAGTAGQLAATIGGAMLPAGPSALRGFVQQTAKDIAPKGAGILQTTKVEPTTREAVGSIKATVGEKVSDVLALPSKRAEIAKTIIETPDNPEVVQYRISGTQVVPDNLASEAIKQGWKEGAVASIKASTPQDRRNMLQMLNIFKMGEKSAKFRALNRPADVLGKSVEKRIDFLSNARNSAGKEIDNIAKTKLKGALVDYDPAISTFLTDLDEIGVQVVMQPNGVAKAVLTGSDIQGDKVAQRILNSVLERLSATKAPDASGVHAAKRFIDTQVSWGKKALGTPLTGQAERVLKNLRRNLNQSLNDTFPEYKAANTKYSETTTALDNMQKAAGTQIDFDSPNAEKQLGTAMRKLLSNIGSRVNLIDALDNVNATSTKYGLVIDDDIVNQLIFANELDRMFGAVADTSLKGQVAEAMQTGVDVARGKIASRAFELLMQKTESLRGINRENAIKAMEEVLKRDSTK